MPESALPLCLLGLLALSSACYIQNCPRGGKRSFLDAGARQCMACGPGNRGRCFGPSICCGEELGCYVGTPETERCLEENSLPSPCEAGGRVCGADEGGRCAAPGICCDEESCMLDSICLDEDSNKRRTSTEKNMTLMGSAASDFLLWLMHMANSQPQGPGRNQQF